MAIGEQGRKTKNVTSCDNVFLTNILLALEGQGAGAGNKRKAKAPIIK